MRSSTYARISHNRSNPLDDLADPPKTAWIPLVILIAIVALVGLNLFAQRPPAPRPDSAPATAFSAARAMQHLPAIASVPHPTGSQANRDVRAYLLGALESLGLETQTQETLGISRTFGTAARVENVLARLPGQSSSGAILLVAHYDSVPSGPGASDNGVAVAAILETLRALQATSPLANDVMVLFSDGEELGLLGAEAFAAEHPWYQEVALVLNFEARGTSGPSVLVETGPDHRQLIRAFAQANPYPNASSVSYEIYRLLPNDTDFTVFKRDGQPGYNFAYIGDFVHYHTALDNLENVNLASMQHHGEHALALARHFGSADLTTVSQVVGDAVYFDVLRLLVVHYPAELALPLAMLVLLALAAVTIFGMRRAYIQPWRTALGLGVFLLSAVLVYGACALAWVLLQRLQPAYTQMWMGTAYHAWVTMVGFVLLAVLTVALFYLLARRWLNMSNLALGVLIGWALLMVPISWQLPGASYLFTWPLLGALLALGYLWWRPKAWWHRALIFGLGVLPGLILMTPLIAMIFQALNLANAALVMVLVAILMGLFYPLLELALIPNRWLLPSLLALAAVAFFGAGSIMAAFNETKPQPTGLMYLLDADTAQAFWISSDAAPNAWTNALLGNATPQDITRQLPDAFGDLLVEQAPVFDLPAPVMQVQQDTLADGLRQLTLRLQSARTAPNLSLLVHPNAATRGFSIDGRPIANIRRPNGWARLPVFGAGETGISVSFAAAADRPVELVLLDIANDLFELPGQPVPKRPAGFMAAPSYHGDASMVRTQLLLEPPTASPIAPIDSGAAAP